MYDYDRIIEDAVEALSRHDEYHAALAADHAAAMPGAERVVPGAKFRRRGLPAGSPPAATVSRLSGQIVHFANLERGLLDLNGLPMFLGAYEPCDEVESRA